MKRGNIILTGILLCSSLIFTQELTSEQKQELGQKVLHEMLQKIFTETMAAKRAFLAGELREDVLSNFSTTAPRSEFIVNADISSQLQDATESAIVYVSMDGQTTWQSAPAALLGTPGYENTWSGTIMTNDGSSAHSYLSGIVNSEALGQDYGTIIVSGSPHNLNGNWPPGNNLYALMASDESGDATTSSDQDITLLRGTYKGNEAVDPDGNEYTNVERFYLSLTISGGCCDPGGGWLGFGPWYLYGIGIVNPESDESDGNAGTAYAIGYGDGGFGELTPGILKISGDLATGDIEGFEYLTPNISTNTSGNDMQATALMSYLTSDSLWGPWPNTYNGFIVLGVTVEAGLDGLSGDVAAEITDQTDPALFVCTTTSQDGNILPVLSNPAFDEETNTLSVSYSDADGNLPWKKTVQLCESGTENCNSPIDMIPDGHTYEDGVTFSASAGDNTDGEHDAYFLFADDDVEDGDVQMILPITIGASCGSVGDVNNDGSVNVVDVVAVVNVILGISAPTDCFDLNGDGSVNVVDIVSLVGIILSGG